MSIAVDAFVAGVFIEIVVAVAAQVAISIRSQVEPADERDCAIQAKAFRNAYYVLTAAICLAAIVITFIGLAQAPTAAAATQLILLCLVSSEAIRYATQVYCYRRGS